MPLSCFKALARARANGSSLPTRGRAPGQHVSKPSHGQEQMDLPMCLGNPFDDDEFQSPRTGKSKWIAATSTQDFDVSRVSKPSHGQEQMDPLIVFLIPTIPPGFKALARARANGSVEYEYMRWSILFVSKPSHGQEQMDQNLEFMSAINQLVSKPSHGQEQMDRSYWI